jgi:hypothetical protein
VHASMHAIALSGCATLGQLLMQDWAHFLRLELGLGFLS